MAWTTPLTAVANAALTAAQWNASVRDNLNETAVAKATTAGQIFVATGANAITVRAPAGMFEPTQEAVTGTSYGNIATVGPTVTVTTGVRAFVFISSFLRHASVGGSTFASYTVTGASSVAADDTQAIQFISGISQQAVRTTAVLFQALTAGSNTFQMKYRVLSGSGEVADRRLQVMSL